MLKTAFFLSASNISTALISLVRNILVARLISVEDFGIASTFAITMAMVEMATDAGFNRLIVQARDAETSRLQDTLQLLQLLRGLTGAVILFVAADLIAFLFNHPDGVWAYRLLALVPLMRGFLSLDPMRQQRQMRFVPFVVTDLGSIVISTLAVIPLAMLFNDFRVMLFVILLQQGTNTVLTHLVAKQKYRLHWDLAQVKQSWEFGWPLLLNGMLLFGAIYGDRLVVGNAIGLVELGWFSAAFMLTYAPTQVAAKTLNGFLLPQLSKVQDQKDEFRHLYLATVQATLLIGVLFVLLFMSIGPWLVTFLYGAKYEAAAGIIVWLSIAQGVRIGKAGPAIVATAKAQTKNPLISNLIRIPFLPAAWFAAQHGGGLIAVVGFAVLAESIGLLTSIYMLRRRLSLPLRSLVVPVLLGLAAMYWGATSSMVLGEDLKWALGVAPVAISVLVLVWAMKDMRVWVRDRLFARQFS